MALEAFPIGILVDFFHKYAIRRKIKVIYPMVENLSYIKVDITTNGQKQTKISRTASSGQEEKRF